MPKLLLLGDSTLDNSYWVSEGCAVSDHLTKQLPGWEIINFAVDGFTTSSMLSGEYKDHAVESIQHTHDFFKTLKALAKEEDVEHILLSVGGNDFREALSDLIYMSPENRPQAIEELAKTLTTNYLQIVNKIKKLKPEAKLTIVLQYTPCIKMDLYHIYFLMDKICCNETISGRLSAYKMMASHYLFGLNDERQRNAIHKLHETMATIYRNLFKTLGKQSMAVIDLASSFDYQDGTSYVSQIEPSNKGGEQIAQLVAHAVTHHNFSGPSIIYAKPACQLTAEILSAPLASVRKNWFPGKVFSTKEQALNVFKKAYADQLSRDKASFSGLYGLFARSHVEPSTCQLDELVHTAQEKSTHGRRSRTRQVMQNLGWLTKQGVINEEGGLAVIFK